MWYSFLHCYACLYTFWQNTFCKLRRNCRHFIITVHLMSKLLSIEKIKNITRKLSITQSKWFISNLWAGWFGMSEKCTIFFLIPSDPVKVKVLCLLILSAPTPQNDQTNSNNSSAVAYELLKCVWPFYRVGAWRFHLVLFRKIFKWTFSLPYYVSIL